MTKFGALWASLTRAKAVVLDRQNHLPRKIPKEFHRLLAEAILQIDEIKPGLSKIARKEDPPRLVNDPNDRFMGWNRRRSHALETRAGIPGSDKPLHHGRYVFVKAGHRFRPIRPLLGFNRFVIHKDSSFPLKKTPQVVSGSAAMVDGVEGHLLSGSYSPLPLRIFLEPEW
jgi:hypothetical protein